MSIIDTIAQKLTGQSGADAGGDSALVNSPDTGGLQGLIQKFHTNGLGDLVNSWVGPGANQAITGDQIASVIGQDRLASIASKFGMQPDQISGLVAQHLPGLVSKLTSGGATQA
jgi:uncharacterized protein YidB (DUF937 family)